MNINTFRYSLFGIAGGQEVDHTFVKFIIYPLTIVVNQRLLQKQMFILKPQTLRKNKIA